MWFLVNSANKLRICHQDGTGILDEGLLLDWDEVSHTPSEDVIDWKHVCWSISLFSVRLRKSQSPCGHSPLELTLPVWECLQLAGWPLSSDVIRPAALHQSRTVSPPQWMNRDFYIPLAVRKFKKVKKRGSNCGKMYWIFKTYLLNSNIEQNYTYQVFS